MLLFMLSVCVDLSTNMSSMVTSFLYKCFAKARDIQCTYRTTFMS